jgi:DNA-binding transcriptional regulator YdaS (Cro superfamily)
MPAVPSAASEIPGPPDKSAVIAALRLGWTLAEFRGRNRPVPPHGDDPRVQRDDHALPLRSERTMTEQAIETRMVLTALAQQFGVDTPPVGGRGTKPATYSTQAQQLARVIDGQRQRHDARLDATWQKLARLLYLWDAHIQDQFTAKSEIQECAYQLGRGLAEAYWSLEATSGDGDDPASWTYLLSDARCAELTRLAGRVSAYLDPLTAPVIARSLANWAAVAADDHWRGLEAAKQLRQQIRHWYALLVLGQDPETFLRESTLKSKWQLTLRALSR